MTVLLRLSNSVCLSFQQPSAISPEQRPSHFFNLLNSRDHFGCLRLSYDL